MVNICTICGREFGTNEECSCYDSAIIIQDVLISPSNCVSLAMPIHDMKKCDKRVVAKIRIPDGRLVSVVVGISESGHPTSWLRWEKENGWIYK